MMSSHPRPAGRRRLTRLTAAGLGASLLLAACGSDGGSSETDGDSSGGSLTVLAGSEPNTMDPIFGDTPSGGRYQYNLVYEPLIRMEPDGEFTPMLAEDYQVSEDGTEIVFTIRDGVTFHDGTDFDAEAVVFNIERLMAEEGATYHYQLDDVEAVEVTGENEVTLSLSQASGSILPYLAHEAGIMVSPTALEEQGDDFGRNPVGTGPFEFVSWSGGQELVVTRFEDYWRTDDDGVQLPYVDEVVTIFQEDPNRARSELETANVDIVERLTPRDVEALEGDPDIEIIDLQRRAQYYIIFNILREPMDQVEVRRALSLAVNNEEMAVTTVGETAEVTPMVLPTTDWAYNGDLEGYGYDPDEARRLLEEAGVSDLSLTFNIIDREPDSQMAQMFQSYLSEVGVDVTIQPLERLAHVEAGQTHDFDLTLHRLTQPTVDPSNAFESQFGAGAPIIGAMLQERGEHEQLFQRIEEARLAGEQEERYELYSGLQEDLIDEAYQLWLFGAPVPYAMRDYVEGLTSDADGQWRLDEVRLDR